MDKVDKMDGVDSRKILVVAGAVEELFKKGVYLSGEMVHHLDSAFGIDGPEAFLQALSPPLDAEAESICEMVLFPDEAQQAALEPVFEEVLIESEPEKAALADSLAIKGLKTAVYFPGAGYPVEIEIPGSAMTRFITRLRPERRIDRRVARAIRENVHSQSTATALKVKLRNARFAFEENRVSSICHFLSSIDAGEPDFMDLFMLLCRICETMDANKDLYTALMKAKRQCAEMIRLAGKSKAALQKEPVEALMMRGVTIAAIDEEAVRRQIAHIDRIAMALFGETEDAGMLANGRAPAVAFDVYKSRG